MSKVNTLAYRCGIWFSGMSSTALANTTPTTISTQAASYLTQLVGGLILVILLILFMAWLLRRLPGTMMQGSQIIEILAVRVIGNRERLLLIQVGEEQLLVGLTPAGLCHLHTLQIPIVVPSIEPQTNDFAKLLNKIRNSGLKK
ncbi:flagellar biosynthetic protein FliO [Chromatium weissei]|nr:flagellar biosynthetic protein FliO [Chromatium weissei]